MGKIENNLKKVREKKKLSLNQVSKETKIHPRILEALEESKFDKMPGSIYARSFIRKYASYLGIDPKPIIEYYNSVYKPTRRQKLYIGKKKLGLDYIKILFVIKAFFISIFAIIVIYLVTNFIRNIIHWPVSKQKETIKQIVKETKISPSKTPHARDIIKKSIPLILTIEAKDDVWIQIKSDGKKIFQNVLSKGKKEEWKARKNFEIWTGKAEKIEIYLNGRNLGQIGKGVVKGILITREGVKLPE